MDIRRDHQKHMPKLPTARTIRRTCSKELYRTRKRLDVWVSEDKMEEAERLYYKKVIPKLIWITENSQNRKKLADWWAVEICPEIAKLWMVHPEALERAFRKAFGG